MASFVLHPQLQRDSTPITELSLCAVRLMGDARYPWLLLVPMQPGLVELTDLGDDDQITLMREIRLASAVLRAVSRCDKLNFAAIGNVVEQLHVHVVARRRGDPAWPKPVWGHSPAEPYTPELEAALVAQLAAKLSGSTETG